MGRPDLRLSLLHRLARSESQVGRLAVLDRLNGTGRTYQNKELVAIPSARCSPVMKLIGDVHPCDVSARDIRGPI